MVDAELEHARLARAFQDSAMDKHMSKDEIRDYAPNEKDDILYLLEEVNRTARRTFDALIVGLDLGRVRQDGVNSALATGHRQAAFAVMCKGWISSSIMV